jgi:hypothetical protein
MTTDAGDVGLFMVGERVVLDMAIYVLEIY